MECRRLFRPLLRHVWEYSRYYLFWVCGSTPVSAIPLFAGVLPQKCCSASGSTPIIKKQSVGPLLREYSRKSGPTILPGVLPKRLFLYTGSDLDMIYNLDILLPLDTLGVLPVLLFLVSGSTPGRLIFGQWKCLLYMLYYSQRADLEVLGVLLIHLFLVSKSTPGRLIFGQWEYKLSML